MRKKLWIFVCILLIGTGIYFTYPYIEENFFQQKGGEVTVPEEEIIKMDSIHYTYEQMEQDLNELSEIYSPILTVDNPSETVDGRNLYVVNLGNKNAEHHVLLHASIHAREYVNTLIVMRQIELLCRNYNTGEVGGRSYREVLDKVCFHIIPMANPDGVTLCQFGLDGIKKDSVKEKLSECYAYDISMGNGESSEQEYWQKWKANGRGIDLNKNFDVNWEDYAPEQHAMPSTQCFKGESPASEAETQTILKVAKQCKAEAVISYHTAGEVIYWEPLEGTCEEELVSLAAELTGYKTDSGEEARTAGGCSNYFNEVLRIPALTIETGVNTNGYPLKEDVIPVIWEKNKSVLVEMMNYFA